MAETHRKYFNMEIEPLLNTPEIKKIQNSKLASTIRFFYEKVPFDRNKMKKEGIKPGDIKTFEDLSKAVPISGQADFRGPWSFPMGCSSGVEPRNVSVRN